MRDVLDDSGASVENALSVVVLAVVFVLAVFVAATSFTVPPSAALLPSSPSYPIKISLSWPSSLDRTRGRGVDPLGPARMEKSPQAAGMPAQVGAGLQAELASDAQPNSNPTAGNPAIGETRAAGSSIASAPFIVSDFSLGSGPSASNAIEISKRVLVNGHAAGIVRMRVDAAAEVYVRQDDIAKLLSGKIAFPKGADQDFIALDWIRDRGIDVRYSAGQDALLITS